MSAVRTAAFSVALGCTAARASHANPVRRVVDMLQGMSDKVRAEGKAQEELFDKFMCYCKSGASDLKTAIQAAETKMPQVTSALKEAEAQHQQLGKDLAQAKADRSEAQNAIAQATSIRNKEASTFAKDSSDFKTNIAALRKATSAIEDGTSASFLQTSNAAKLQQITINAEMSSVDRDLVSAFLTQGQEGRTVQSGEILGILKQLTDTMEANLADITKTEQSATKSYEELVATKKKELESIGASIEAKLAQEGEVGESIVMMKEDLDDTGKAYVEDRKFLADLDQTCATKKAEWEEIQKMRSEELLAIADTIKILNDDDSLELFKKTLPSASLLQTTASASATRQQALDALRGHKDSRMELIALTLRGGAKNFDKVLAMVDEMVGLLGDEQKSDDNKKDYCEKSLDKSEDERKVLEQTSADLEKAIEEAKETVAALSEELDALADGVKKLDRDVAEATEMRQADHQEFTDTMAANSAAKELIGIAKNRLAKFYAPSLYKAPPKRELTREERITVNMGGTLAPTAAPGGIAGTGVAVFAQISAHTVSSKAAPPPAPETFGAYEKKGQESNGVMELMDMMVADLDKEMQTMSVDEKNSQAEYEQFVADSADKRALDTQAITDKEVAKASTEGSLQQLSGEHKDTQMATMAKEEEIKNLHLECDWLVSNYQTRKTARTSEIESLKKAKAVLSGADYSLAQTGHAVTLRR